MYKHECYKIFSRKSLYVVFFLVVLIMIYANSLPNSMTMKEDIYEDLLETWGGSITEEKIAIAREQMRKSDSGESTTYTAEDRATGLVHNLYVVASMNIESLNEQKEISKDNKDTVTIN